MKIEVKYNINFGKALKELEGNKLSETLNEGVSDKFAKNSFKFIQSGKVEPKLSKNNPRGQKAPPLFDTGKLAKSLKGTSRGVTGVSYAKEHREPGGYLWFKGGVDSKGFGKGGSVDVPQREFIPHFEDSTKGRRVVALRGTKAALTKIYEDFEKKFIRLLNKRIRKR